MKKYCKKIWSVLILVFLICSCKTEEEPADSSQSEILASLMQKLEFYDSKKINAIKENEASEEKVISVPPAKVTEITAQNLDSKEITNSITESEETNDVFENIHTGDLIFSDGLVEGIVFGKNEEGIPLYVSIDKVQNLQWAVENSAGAVTKINAIAAKIANSTDFANIEFTGDTNGSDNFDEIIALSINDNSFSIENYPIFAFASNTGDNWYIPTAKEIYDLYSEKDLINKKLAELQKDPLFEDGHWWTSSQGAKKDTAFYLNLDTDRFSDGKKTISRKCCLIKKLKADYNSTQP
ncbi:MAG: hypothetical protein MR877_09110 [Spirochaetia bacterium]|nr:hypothetical protein [Spirochaetia bacterium]